MNHNQALEPDQIWFQMPALLRISWMLSYQILFSEHQFICKAEIQLPFL